MGLIDNLPNNIKKYIEINGNNLAENYIRFLSKEQIEGVFEIIQHASIWNEGIPFATTAFGDVIVWEKGYVMLYKFTEENYTVILSGTDFLFVNFEDEAYKDEFFDMELYRDAIVKCGEVTADECYTLEPIPRLGGKRELKYINKGKLMSYLGMIAF